MEGAELSAVEGMPVVSVVVPSYNSGSTIGECLDALDAQRTAVPYEVIVADSSDDGSGALIARHAARPGSRVRLLRSEARLFPGPARNLALGEARGAILAFTDADCIVAPDWVETIHRLHATHDAVGGRIANGTPASACGTALWLVEFAEFAGGAARQVASIPSCNLSFKRALLERHGPFPEVSWGEEYILNRRIPGGIRYAPAMLVTHVNRTAPGETVRHARKVGAGCALSRRATGEHRVLFVVRPLIALLVPWRLAATAARSARAGAFLAFLRASPMVLVDLVAWTAGFWSGAAARGDGGTVDA
jgi:glycosyltransferase involved in cell wall biosynthesis